MVRVRGGAVVLVDLEMPARVAPPPAARLGTRARSRSYRAAPKTPPQSKSPASMGERGFDTGIGRRDAA
ncbi:hypothetical protein AQ908_28240 [Burkholderia pseudomallei]|nr:hypothetical protein AQ908_28240 [Burkholderia pseudomallei]